MRRERRADAEVPGADRVAPEAEGPAPRDPALPVTDADEDVDVPFAARRHDDRNGSGGPEVSEELVACRA